MAVSAKPSSRFCADDFGAAIAFMAAVPALYVLGEDGDERENEKSGGVMP
jgi:hypothetical protein